MILVILLLIAASFAISWLVTQFMRRFAPRIGFVDKPGGRKSTTTPSRSAAVSEFSGGCRCRSSRDWDIWRSRSRQNFCDRNRSSDPRSPATSTRIGGGLAFNHRSRGKFCWPALMHVLGLFDDRKALGPMFKLVVQLAIIAALVLAANRRILTFLDEKIPGGRGVSIILTILWIAAVTNAFNFLDNMDGLSAGVAAVCTAAFLVATLSIGQWFVAAGLALLLGSTLGFLWHNFPPAKIFMGDGGSLLLGFILGVLTVLTTYLSPGGAGPTTGIPSSPRRSCWRCRSTI